MIATVHQPEIVATAQQGEQPNIPELRQVLIGYGPDIHLHDRIPSTIASLSLSPPPTPLSLSLTRTHTTLYSAPIGSCVGASCTNTALPKSGCNMVRYT